MCVCVCWEHTYINIFIFCNLHCKHAYSCLVWCRNFWIQFKTLMISCSFFYKSLPLYYIIFQTLSFFFFIYSELQQRWRAQICTLKIVLTNKSSMLDIYLWMLSWLQGTTPTLATASTCFLMVWLEVFAVVIVAEVSFMPRSLPEEMQNEPAISQRRVVKIQLGRRQQGRNACNRNKRGFLRSIE